MSRILMITDGRFADQIRVSNEARAMASAGLQVEVHALDSFCDNASWEWHGVTVHQHRLPKWCHWARVLNAELPFYALVVARTLKKALAHAYPDVIHVHNLFVWRGARKLTGQWPKVKWVLDIAENLPEIMQEYDHVKRGLGRWMIRPSRWAELQARALNDADHVVLVTQAALADYTDRLGLMPDKGVICDNVPWDDHIGMEGLDGLKRRFADAFVLFYFGDTSRRRGTDLAILAMPRIVAAVPNAHLVIVGKNNREDVFLQELKSLSPVGDHIHLEGFQPMASLGAYLSVANVGLSPLVRNVHHDTTHANKLFQFMHGALPLVVSDCPAQANLVTTTNTGLVHRGGDVDSLVEVILTLAQNPSMAREMGERGQAAVKARFNWHEEIQPYLQRVCGRAHQRS